MTTSKLACCPSLPHFVCRTLHSCELRNTNFSLLCFMFQLVFFHRVFLFSISLCTTISMDASEIPAICDLRFLSLFF